MQAPFGGATRRQGAQLPPREAGVDAEHRVCARYGVDAERAEEMTPGKGDPGTPRLAGKQAIAARSDRGEEPSEVRILEMVQKEVGDDQIPTRRRAVRKQRVRGRGRPVDDLMGH